MRNFTRWAMFTAVTATLWLAGGFFYLVLSRLYAALQLPTFLLLLLCLMAGATTIAAIGFAAKLDGEDESVAARLARRRAHPIPLRRPQR